MWMGKCYTCCRKRTTTYTITSFTLKCMRCVKIQSLFPFWNILLISYNHNLFSHISTYIANGKKCISRHLQTIWDCRRREKKHGSLAATFSRILSTNSNGCRQEARTETRTGGMVDTALIYQNSFGPERKTTDYIRKAKYLQRITSNEGSNESRI